MKDNITLLWKKITWVYQKYRKFPWCQILEKFHRFDATNDNDSEAVIFVENMYLQKRKEMMVEWF